MQHRNRSPWLALIVALVLAVAGLASLVAGTPRVGAQAVVQPRFDPPYDPAVIDGVTKPDSILVRCGSAPGTMEFIYNAWDQQPRWFVISHADGRVAHSGGLDWGQVVVLTHEPGWHVDYYAGDIYPYDIIPGQCTPEQTTTTQPATTTAPPDTTTTAPPDTTTTAAPTTTTAPPSTTTTEAPPAPTTTAPPAPSTTEPPVVTASTVRAQVATGLATNELGIVPLPTVPAAGNRPLAVTGPVWLAFIIALGLIVTASGLVATGTAGRWARRLRTTAPDRGPLP